MPDIFLQELDHVGAAGDELGATVEGVAERGRALEGEGHHGTATLTGRFGSFAGGDLLGGLSNSGDNVRVGAAAAEIAAHVAADLSLVVRAPSAISATADMIWPGVQ